MFYLYIFVYSYIQQKDLLLYDFTLQLGDSLPRLYLDWDLYNEEYGNVVDYPTITGKVDPIVVVDVSELTLLDGKQYKKWTFNNGMEYVENIGAYGHYNYAGDFFQLIANIPVPCQMGFHLICVSKEGMLIYQIDEEKMDSLGVECLCQGIANAGEEIQVSQTRSTKIINNSQLLILNANKTYNVMGVEVK